MLVISAGLFRETRVQTTIQGIIVVTIGMILAPKYGIYGVLLGSILSNIYRNIDLLFFVPKNITGLPVRNTAKRMLKIIITTLIIFLSFLLIDVNSSSYFEWIIDASLIGVYSVIVVIIVSLMFDRETTKGIVDRCLRMMKR